MINFLPTSEDLRAFLRTVKCLPAARGRTSPRVRKCPRALPNRAASRYHMIRWGCSAAAAPRGRLRFAIGFAILVMVPFKPHHLAVALEREHVRGDAIEEPAVVADHDGAAGEVEQRLFERAQRVDVEVVGRLVEQQQVAPSLQQLRQVHAVALAARQRADLALLRRALEVEPRDVGARRHLALAEPRSRRRRR